MEGLISPELARILDSKRSAFNGLFADYSRRYPGIDPDDFMISFAAVADPALAAVRRYSEGARKSPLSDEGAGSLLQTLYADLLECSGRGLIGGSGRHPLLEKALITILSGFPRACRDDPDGGCSDRPSTPSSRSKTGARPPWGNGSP